MGFLIKSAFWLSLVLLIIPFDAGVEDDGARSVGPIEALNAAQEAVGDIGGICERKPDVCETGRAALHTITLRAREASRLAFEMLDERATPDDAVADAGGAALDDETGIAAIIQADAAETTGSVPEAN